MIPITYDMAKERMADRLREAERHRLPQDGIADAPRLSVALGALTRAGGTPLSSGAGGRDMSNGPDVAAVAPPDAERCPHYHRDADPKVHHADPNCPGRGLLYA